MEGRQIGMRAGERGTTSESAEVQSDVGPDRAATGTEGVKKRRPSQQRNLPYKGRRCRSSANKCAISEVFELNGDLSSSTSWNSLQSTRRRSEPVYHAD